MGPAGCLLDDFDVSYAPSSALVANLWRRPGWKTGSFVGIADPEGDLPMARAEVRAAAGIFQRDSKVLEGHAASKEAALSRIHDVDWLHFACHANLILGDTEGTGIRLARQGDDKSHILNLDEMTRRGRLKENAVVVLSACETNSTMPYYADEDVSIAGGVVTAGARSVVATMWKVRDACAALVMSRFYREIAEGEADLSKALARACEMSGTSMNATPICSSLCFWALRPPLRKIPDPCWLSLHSRESTIVLSLTFQIGEVFSSLAADPAPPPAFFLARRQE
jgi:CHAT domain-containing protein